MGFLSTCTSAVRRASSGTKKFFRDKVGSKIRFREAKERGINLVVKVYDLSESGRDTFQQPP